MNMNGADDKRKHGFDWQDVGQRIAVTNVALAESGKATPEMVQQIWAHRAAQLAQVPTQEDNGKQIELVLVRLGRELYGLNAQCIFEIRPAEQITHVPRVPDWVTGVVNVRGRILSVVDLRQFFGLPTAEQDESEPNETIQAFSHLVIVETPEMEVALLTDDVLAVENVSVNQIQDTSSTVRGLRPEYVRGVVECRGGEPSTNGKALVVVLDLPVLLADERLVVREEIV